MPKISHLEGITTPMIASLSEEGRDVLLEQSESLYKFLQNPNYNRNLLKNYLKRDAFYIRYDIYEFAKGRYYLYDLRIARRAARHSKKKIIEFFNPNKVVVLFDEALFTKTVMKNQLRILNVSLKDLRKNPLHDIHFFL